MGRYIDWDDVVGRYPELAQKVGNSSTGSYWLNYAEDEVDARLAPKYTVPFTPAPGVVQDLSIDLTCYKLTIKSEGADKIWEYLENRFKGLIEGTLLLTTSGSILATGDMAAVSNSYHTSFGVDDPTNWRVDSRWIGDLQDARGQI